jgi:DNA polymerase-3 subunit delta
MTQLRGAEIDRFLAGPPPDKPVILLFGPDPGGVSERAAAVTKTLVGGDDLAVVRLDESDLSDANRLADEAYGSSLFSGRRVLRVRPGSSRTVAASLESILADPPADIWIVLEAGDLRKASPLRKLCEASPRAAAIGCYPDNDASLGRMIDAEVKAAGLTIEPDARATLIALLGADRAASRSEIQKLCLYARSAGTVTTSDITAVIDDGTAFAIDDIVDAAALGDVASVDRGLRRLLAAGTAASTVGVAAERHFLLLHRLRAAADRGGGMTAALQSLRPPVLPSRRGIIERQVRLWPRQELDATLTRINQAMIESRLHPAVASAVIARTLLGIAARAARLTRRTTA